MGFCKLVEFLLSPQSGGRNFQKSNQVHSYLFCAQLGSFLVDQIWIWTLNRIQNIHKELHFTKCCANKKKVVRRFNLGKNFSYIFSMFVFDKYWVNFAKLFSIKFDKLFNHISPNQDIFSSQLQSWWRRKPKSDCYQFTQRVYFPQRAFFLLTKLSPGMKLFFII